MIKTGIYVTAASILILLLIFSSISNGLLVSKVTLATFGTISFSAPVPTYYISQTGAYTNVLSEPSGNIVYSNANANLAFSKAFGLVATGGILTVDAGTYTINAPGLQMENCQNVNLKFQLGAFLSLANYVNNSVLWMQNDSNCIISGISINGNGQNQALSYYDCGVNLYDCSNCLVTNANITNVRVMGFNVGDDVPGDLPNGITNSLVTNCGWNCISLGIGGSDSVGDYAINNTCINCGDVGIANLAIGSYVLNNKIYNITGIQGSVSSHIGISVEAESIGITIENNTIVNCTNANGGSMYGDGIAIGTGSAVGENLVRYNSITNCGDGISTLNSAGDVISNNQISNWGLAPGAGYRLVANGICIESSVNEMVTSNTLSSSSANTLLGPSIYLTNSVNCSVCNNTVTTQLSAQDYGVILESYHPDWGPNGTVIEGNNIQAYYGISIDSGCSNNRLNQNDLTNCTTQIIDLGTGDLDITPSTFVPNSILTINCPSAYGAINPIAGSYLESNSSQVTITLTPNATYNAVLNVDGVNVILTDNTYTLSMNTDHVLYAVFSR